MKEIGEIAQGVFIPRGIELPCLDQHKLWEFSPNKTLKVGSVISGGDIIGTVNENSLFQDHKIMVDPKLQGRVVEVFPAA